MTIQRALITLALVPMGIPDCFPPRCARGRNDRRATGHKWESDSGVLSPHPAASNGGIGQSSLAPMMRSSSASWIVTWPSWAMAALHDSMRRARNR